MPDRHPIIGLDDEPLTAGALLDEAISRYRLPPRTGALDSWVNQAPTETIAAFAKHAVDAARLADFATVVHFAHQIAQALEAESKRTTS